MRTRRHQRGAAVMLEAAFMYPAFIMLIIGMVVGGVGVFRYQQVAGLTREAARWVAVRGSTFERTTDQASPTQQQVFEYIIAAQAAGIPLENMTLLIDWVDQSTGAAQPWNTAPRDVLSVSGTGEYVTNNVRVTLSYQWSPAGFGLRPLTMQSVCEMPMSN